MTGIETPRALVLGSRGQDGSYLVEHLLRRGYTVAGVARGLQPRGGPELPPFRHVCLDLRQPARLASLLAEWRPATIFHFAAVHGRAGTRYETEWQDMLAVNVGAVHVCLEYLRQHQPAGVLVYAGSSKVFGPVFPSVVTEQSPLRATCLYTVTKNAALDLISCYRRDHGIKASVLHFFNHESERRESQFFVPKLVASLYRSLRDQHHRAVFDTLEFHCDWGAAEEYTDIAVDIAERMPVEDVIVATGRTLSGRELAKQIFARHGLQYQNHVVDRGAANPANCTFAASTERLARMIGRTPQVGIVDVCERILAALVRENEGDIA
ncbi:MAG: GDP-mannose 4,6-dehydratase [Xanthobacteraceae bacterium]|nr:GDP-mannose 4,6-dehydratase [Xanthobacteraceae bacterium]